MSFIVRGMQKPLKCAEWRDSRLKKCPLLDENDDCKMQRKKGRGWDEQYADCPIVSIKRKHGALVDESNGEIVLEAEDDTWTWKRGFRY